MLASKRSQRPVPKMGLTNALTMLAKLFLQVLLCRTNVNLSVGENNIIGRPQRTSCSCKYSLHAQTSLVAFSNSPMVFAALSRE